jgi:hypothetical protein
MHVIVPPPVYPASQVTTVVWPTVPKMLFGVAQFELLT